MVQFLIGNKTIPRSQLPAWYEKQEWLQNSSTLLEWIHVMAHLLANQAERTHLWLSRLLHAQVNLAGWLGTPSAPFWSDAKFVPEESLSASISSNIKFLVSPFNSQWCRKPIALSVTVPIPEVRSRPGVYSVYCWPSLKKTAKPTGETAKRMALQRMVLLSSQTASFLLVTCIARSLTSMLKHV